MSKLYKMLVPALIVLLLLGIFLVVKKNKPNENSIPTTTSGNNSPKTEDSNKPSNEFCSIGFVVVMQGIQMKITGFESYTINNKKLTLCCAQQEISGQNAPDRKAKYCYNSDNYSITFKYDSENNSWIKLMENYPIDGKICSDMYDPLGINIVAHICNL